MRIGKKIIGADRADWTDRTDRTDRAYGLLIGLIGLMGLMGCSKDEASSKEPMGSTELEVASYVRWFEEADGANRANGANRTNKANGTNRAWAIPSGYVAYEDGVQPIGIAFTQNDQEPKIGYFFKSSGKWRTSLDNIAGSATYHLYGYIPNMAGINYSITDYDGTKGAYSEGAIMTLKNVPTVMPNDLCVVIGAKEGYDREHDGNIDGTNRLCMGDFSFKAASSANENFVFLLFDHLYAALRIRMKVYEDYNNLRTIKLKSLQLSTQADGETTKQRTTITVKLKKTNGSISPIDDIKYAQTGSAIDGGQEFWSSTAGEELGTAFTEYIGHFMPNGITRLSLTSVYDVYDKKENLIRKDCKATNHMLLSELFSGQTATERGKRYTVNITIQPTYLYMLSEPDLDNPTVVVN